MPSGGSILDSDETEEAAAIRRQQEYDEDMRLIHAAISSIPEDYELNSS
jgi:hypothetical protein